MRSSTEYKISSSFDTYRFRFHVRLCNLILRLISTSPRDVQQSAHNGHLSHLDLVATSATSMDIHQQSPIILCWQLQLSLVDYYNFWFEFDARVPLSVDQVYTMLSTIMLGLRSCDVDFDWIQGSNTELIDNAIHLFPRFSNKISVFDPL